jgi:uncharacterized protein YndB with AHSA1/START domain
MLKDAQAETVVDTSTNSIVLTRTFSASREQVFDAWSQPQHVSLWWDPHGRPLKDCAIDLRPNGAFKFVLDGEHPVPAFAGFYKEIVRPKHLVFEAFGAIGRITLESVNGRTLLTVAIQCASSEHLKQFLQQGIDKGTAQTLDNLVAYLGGDKGR